MQVTETNPTVNPNTDNLQRAQQSFLHDFTYLSDRLKTLQHIQYYYEEFPPQVIASPFNFAYSSHSVDFDIEFTVTSQTHPHLTPDEVWRLNSRELVDIRRYFKTTKWHREVRYDKSVIYYGTGQLPYDNKEYTFRFNVKQGGLPPTCTIVEELVTQVHTYTKIKTVCR